MAEKQYIAHFQNDGKVMISEDVIAGIAKHALMDVEGCVGVATKSGSDLVDRFGTKSWSRGVKVVIADNSKTIIECNVIVLYGSNVVELAANIQEAVISAVRPMVGISDVTVNVNICGIVRK
jgi:uncharacterized alkaline shock family protein YloU